MSWAAENAAGPFTPWPKRTRSREVPEPSAATLAALEEIDMIRTVAELAASDHSTRVPIGQWQPDYSRYR